MVGYTGIRHPNILQILGAGKDLFKTSKDKNGTEKIYTVSELADGGELFNFVQEVGRFGSFEYVTYEKQIFVQLISAIEATHNAGIVHRDVKLDNCFLSKDV